jgi:hypothetical protein
MAREGQHSGIDDDTRARARRFVEDADMPKPAVTGRATPKQRIVSKKELEESGLSLRDFLNRERGLTRRGMSVADAKKQLGLDKIDQEVAASTERAPRRNPSGPMSGDYMSESAKSRGVRNMYERGAEETNAGMKRGGKVSSASKRADGIAQRGKTRA